jgi:hypothetical protein
VTVPSATSTIKSSRSARRGIEMPCRSMYVKAQVRPVRLFASLNTWPRAIATA